MDPFVGSHETEKEATKKRRKKIEKLINNVKSEKRSAAGGQTNECTDGRTHGRNEMKVCLKK